VPRTTIFIGSSGAARAQAKKIVAAFETPTVQFVPWWDAFAAGDTLLANLDRIRGSVDAAVLVVSPESETTIRGNTVTIPNLNVLFEFGYFYGYFGGARVAIIRYGELYLPSDLGGYVHVFGSKFFKRSYGVPIGKRTRDEFQRWLARV
jgi:predicted nucleotide-binding protein